MKIEGYLPTGIVRDVTYYFSKTKKKFVDSVEKVYLGDLFVNRETAEKSLDINDYPIVDKYGGVVKVSLQITL